MKNRPLAFALLLSLAPAVALPPRAAFAQAADDTTTKMARQRFQEGVSFYDKGQFEMARAAFLQAYALRKHPVVLMNLAQSSLKSGHALEAARYFQQFLKDYSSATEAQRNDANKGLSDARTKLGRIDVVGAVAGADVFVDDERVGAAPLDHSIDVEPGTHTVRSGDQTAQVTASAGVGATARLGSSSAAAPAPAAAEAPAEAAPAPAPDNAPAPPPPAQPPPQEEPSGSHHWGWVAATGAVTVVGFVTAAIMGSEKAAAQNSANVVAQTIVANGGGQGTCYVGPNSPTPYYANACSALNSDDNNVNSDATIANVGIAVGVVGAVGLVISTIFTVKSYSHDDGAAASASASAGPVTVMPLLGKGLGGMTLGGTF
jgi:tetratricopeptide (TPR) repeat protein